MTAIAPSLVLPPNVPALNGRRKYISWQLFERKYLSRGTGFKYEWSNGVVKKTPRTMRGKQWFICAQLDELFQSLKIEGKANGMLMAGPDIFLATEAHKRPDLAYLTSQQIKDAKDSNNAIPGFAIEIISPSESAIEVQDKVREYLEGGVKVVWNIYPSLKEVHIFTDLQHSTICRKEQLCSAESVIPGFVLSANRIFGE